MPQSARFVLVLLLAAAPLWGQALVRPIPGEYRGLKQCTACHELSHFPNHHEETMRRADGILKTTVNGETVSVFDPRTPGYDTYVAPYKNFFSEANVVYTIGGHGWMQRFLTQVVPAPDDPTRASILPDNDMVVMGIQWNQRKGRWEDFHGPSGDGTWASNSFNTKCGSCHATGFAPKDTQRLARWVDIGITCESCHGPSSELNPLKTDSKQHNEVCGQCHTRGVSRTDGYEFPWNDKLGGGFQPRRQLDQYIEQVTFDAEHFWSDGESRDHHQQWPDYQRSRHSAAGIRCTECHHPHKNEFPGQLRDTSTGVCLSCHSDKLLNSADRYEHSRHTDRQATCIDCHMPRTARAVDAGDIRSHTFFLIEPQKTREFGIPSGCVDCHTNGPGSPKSQKDLEAAFREISPSFRETALIPVPDGPGRWTGFALANLGQRAARLFLTLFDPSGRVFSGAGVVNPRLMSLEPGAQYAAVADDFFGGPLPNGDAWVRVSHYQPGVKGFYLDGNDAGTELTGLPVGGAQSRTWVSPVLWPTGDNRLSLTNLSSDDAAVVLEPRFAGGAPAGNGVAGTVPARGRRSFYFRSLFPALPSGGYVAVRSDAALEGQVTALESITLATVRLFSADGGSSTLTLPHVVSGDGWETRLVFYNPLDRSVEIQVQMRRDGAGSLPYGGIGRRTLAPGAMLNEPLSAFIPASSARAEGYLLVRTTNSADRIQGAVAFSALRGGAVAALGSEATGRKQLTFAHVAQGNGYWTGLALLAPGGGSAVVELHARDGAVLGTKSVTLADRTVGTLGQFFDVGDVSGGYIQVRSETPIFAFELFGNERGSILAAVPPQ
jgi:predicted CXXCH cytochrome family protein